MFLSEGPTFLELARQALSSTQRGYDLLAPKFDRTPFRTPDEILAAMVAALGPSGRALDLCCGTGADLRRVVEDGKILFAFDLARKKPLKTVTEYFLQAVEGVRANKQKYAGINPTLAPLPATIG